VTEKLYWEAAGEPPPPRPTTEDALLDRKSGSKIYNDFAPHRLYWVETDQHARPFCKFVKSQWSKQWNKTIDWPEQVDLALSEFQREFPKYAKEPTCLPAVQDYKGVELYALCGLFSALGRLEYISCEPELKSGVLEHHLEITRISALLLPLCYALNWLHSVSKYLAYRIGVLKKLLEKDERDHEEAVGNSKHRTVVAISTSIDANRKEMKKFKDFDKDSENCQEEVNSLARKFIECFGGPGPVHEAGYDTQKGFTVDDAKNDILGLGIIVKKLLESSISTEDLEKAA